MPTGQDYGILKQWTRLESDVETSQIMCEGEDLLLTLVNPKKIMSIIGVLKKKDISRVSSFENKNRSLKSRVYACERGLATPYSTATVVV